MQTETQSLDVSSPSPSLSSQLFVKADCELGEGPFWFDGRLWWVDIEAGVLHSVDGTGRNPTRDVLGQKLGAAAPIGAYRFVVALENDVAVYDRTSSALRVLASHDTNARGARFNDGKCDPRGRFLAGTLSSSSRESACSLYSYEPVQGLRTLCDGVILSNGLAWDQAGTTLYYIDSMRREVAAFAYDLETGSLRDQRVVVEVPAELGVPDGMTIDAEGNLWIAHWGGYAVRCWCPRTGACLQKIDLPCAQPTSCCFGGPDFKRLFITTARMGLSPEELAAQPLAGSVFFCDLETHGFPPHRFQETPIQQ